MTKETVRYPDSVVDHVEELVADGTFDSKSEFYRFSAAFVLRSLLPEYTPETFEFQEILDEIASDGGLDRNGGPLDDAGFVEAVLSVRRHALRGEVAAAEAVIDSTYRPDDLEAVLLEEVLDHHRR